MKGWERNLHVCFDYGDEKLCNLLDLSLARLHDIPVARRPHSPTFFSGRDTFLLYTLSSHLGCSHSFSLTNHCTHKSYVWTYCCSNISTSSQLRFNTQCFWNCFILIPIFSIGHISCLTPCHKHSWIIKVANTCSRRKTIKSNCLMYQQNRWNR